jgi:hypothetical protein
VILVAFAAFAALAGFLAGRAWTGEEPAAAPADDSFWKPGPEHEAMKAHVGTWDVSGELWMSPDAPPASMKSKATFEMVLGDRYLVQKTEGEGFMPEAGPFGGLGISGYDRVAKRHFSVWFDTMGTGMMSSTGTTSEDGKVLTLTGSGDFGAGPTSWRMVQTTVNENAFTLDMYVTSGDQPEHKAMTLRYTRP